MPNADELRDNNSDENSTNELMVQVAFISPPTSNIQSITYGADQPTFCIWLREFPGKDEKPHVHYAI